MSSQWGGKLMVWCSTLSSQFREYLKRKRVWSAVGETEPKRGVSSHVVRTTGSLYMGLVSPLESMIEWALFWKSGWDLRSTLMGFVRPRLGLLIPLVSRGLRGNGIRRGRGCYLYTATARLPAFQGERRYIIPEWVPYHWDWPLNLPPATQLS